MVSNSLCVASILSLNLGNMLTIPWGKVGTERAWPNQWECDGCLNSNPGVLARKLWQRWSKAGQGKGAYQGQVLSNSIVWSYLWILPSLRFRPDRFNWPLFLAAFNSPCGTEAPKSFLSALKPTRVSRSATPFRRDMFKPLSPEAEPGAWRLKVAPACYPAPAVSARSVRCARGLPPGLRSRRRGPDVVTASAWAGG